ncbi:hypothetical protein K402DRAFT_463189 [Aulographum hederae CBS 113979]|uniref:non-specific serine/threonine protein kinase n=1 Tax=Aulographum hederae CBS 113979 TaxID=1176131 RepID=A0A6G1H250_9PEZI|nr:hypothetical protein K402DRAFT_463189 [Aulographum hederae CBS 113979]
MARRGGVGQATQSGVFGANGDLPPSTLAAKIVNNQSESNRLQEPEQRELFGTLLQEYLNDPAVEESNVTTNAQLIYAVGSAGLEGLLKDDPFSSHLRVEQALTSLSVIQLTIGRNPEVLSYAEPQDSESIAKPPVFLWLLPKLLAMLGHKTLPSLQLKVEELLQLFVQTKGRSLALWKASLLMRRVYETCIADILNVLEGTQNQPSMFMSFAISLPSSKAIGHFSPNSLQAIALPPGCQASIDSALQAILICLVLLKIVGASEVKPGASIIDQQTSTEQMVVSSCHRILTTINTSLLLKVPSDIDPILSAFCKAVRSLLLAATPPEPGNEGHLRPWLGLFEMLLELPSLPEAPDLQIEITNALILLYRNCGASRHWQRTCDEMLSPAILELVRNQDRCSILAGDLQAILSLWTKSADFKPSLPNDVHEIIEKPDQDPAERSISAMLDQAVSGLALDDSEAGYDEALRPPKRQKTDRDGDTTMTGQDEEETKPHEQLLSILGARSWQGVQEIDQSSRCANFSDEAIEEILSVAAKIPCDATASFETIANVSGVEEEIRQSCLVCESDPSSHRRRAQHLWDTAEHQGSEQFIYLVNAVCITVDKRKSKKLRILAAIVILRLCNHLSGSRHMNFEGSDSQMGQWCLRSLSSSVRELRIAAGRALPGFLRRNLPPDVRKRNRMYAFNILKALTDRGSLPEQESIIMAWTQVARVCDEDELNIALLQLIEYLGHTHNLICAVAYTELLRLADDFSCSPADLFKPFWRSIAVVVVRDLHTRPQKAQQLCDLMGVSVNQMLLDTQAETIPYLILTKKKDVLHRIAAAQGKDIHDICMKPRKHLASILAILLSQRMEDIEQATMDLLCEAAPGFRETDLASLVKLEPILTACELLKAASAAGGSNRIHVTRAIKTLASLMERVGQHRAPPKSSKTLAAFLETHVLGIMTHFAEVIDPGSGNESPISDKVRCLHAIEDMIAIAKGYNFSIAIPQIRACLQSAMEVDELRDMAFSVWFRLMTVIDVEDVDALLDHTFSVMARYWKSFSADTNTNMFELMGLLVDKHRTLITDRVDTLPSLGGIPVLSKFYNDFSKFKGPHDVEKQLEGYAFRCRDENSTVVEQALTELANYLEVNQRFIHETAVSQEPSPVVADLMRSILDASLRFADGNKEVVRLCTECLGVIGSLDTNRVEAPKEKREVIMLSNFEKLVEVVDFVAFLLENVLVKAFHSATNAKAQNYLAYAMQELLRFGQFPETVMNRARSSQSGSTYQRWIEMPEFVRNTLTPFFSSKYHIVNAKDPPAPQEFPIFKTTISHGFWLRAFAYEILRWGNGDNARMVFPVISRVVKGPDMLIAKTMLPFVVLNVVIGGTESQTDSICKEFMTVLEQDMNSVSQAEAENIKQCSENVFDVLDYLSRWLQEKRKSIIEARQASHRTGTLYAEVDELRDVGQTSSVEHVLSSIPAETISGRAVDCKSYARALFHWEQYMRTQKELKNEDETTDMYKRLQEIYAEIDEPDAIEGISSRLPILDPDQQILEHRRAGRWAAAQSWYEASLADDPDDVDLQGGMMECLRESGRYDSLLNYIESLFDQSITKAPTDDLYSFAAEAAWSTGRWATLEKFVNDVPDSSNEDLNVAIGHALLALRDKNDKQFLSIISGQREVIARSFTTSNTASLQACHEQTLSLHILYEIEAVSGFSGSKAVDKATLLEVLDRRLDALGAFTSNKQYVLGIRRAVMRLSAIDFSSYDISSAWLTSARLARKSNNTNTAYDAVLRASRLHDDAAKIEHSKLLWKGGQHRKAIQNLEDAIKTGAFKHYTLADDVARSEDPNAKQNSMVARAQLLLAKWIDIAGQSNRDQIIARYQHAVRMFTRWDKGHYYLGRYYNKILEAEKALPVAKQSDRVRSGETAKLVVDNYTRSLGFGTKYYYHTIPKILTLWLDLGMEVHALKDSAHNKQADRDVQCAPLKTKHLALMHKHLIKYIDKVPAFIFYTAFPQIISRISHPHSDTWKVLSQMIHRIATTHPQQALWSLLAVSKSTAPDKCRRATEILNKLKLEPKRGKAENGVTDLKHLINHGQKLSEALLQACEAEVSPRASHVSLGRDLMFNHKLAPCQLVVPIEATMMASVGTVLSSSAQIRSHKPFPRGSITIAAFQDDVLVLSSLQRPRKLTVRGSDGRNYGLLCKPKDDLRKDQRLMEFNSMIGRALKRNVEASKRQLYIRTYAVTPLNEECGTIEWVDGLKPLRDIIMKNYKDKNIRTDFTLLRNLLDSACADPANIHIFTDEVLSKFPPVLYEWFIETFPEPEEWLASRLRYTRSCAVMSMVGHVLGLGDRHGENILLEEGSGGVFHVDFNCLFDKGLAFEKAEKVPFRLTHNMTDAFGSYEVEGPFRTASELTLKILRQYEDALMTILEVFLYDPTTDFIGPKKKKVKDVPDTPQEVLENVRMKLRGLMKEESVPLSVEGYVDALVKAATDPWNLASMYIGWCPFF